MFKTSARVLLLALLCLCPLQAQDESDYVGLWWVSHGDGAPLQIRLYADGTAWSDYPSNNPGHWEVRHGRMVCVWADDWKEVFELKSGRIVKFGFRPGVDVDAPPSNVSKALRGSSSPDGWFGVRKF